MRIMDRDEDIVLGLVEQNFLSHQRFYYEIHENLLNLIQNYLNLKQIPIINKELRRKKKKLNYLTEIKINLSECC